MQHPHAWLFQKALDPALVPELSEATSTPFSLSTIRERLMNARYLSQDDLLQDVNKVSRVVGW